MLTVGPGKQVWPAPEQTERQRLSHKQVWAHTPAWSPCFLVMGEHRTSSRKAGLLLLAFHSETSLHLTSASASAHSLAADSEQAWLFLLYPAGLGRGGRKELRLRKRRWGLILVHLHKVPWVC